MPENTLVAFEHALGIGVTTLELDIAFTRDGVAVISHDARLNPAITRDPAGRWLSGPGPLIRSLTLAELQAYDVGRIAPATAYGRQFASQQAKDGARIPTLASLFERVEALGADQLKFNIETKIHPDHPGDSLPPEEFVDALLAQIRDSGMTQRVTIQSFDWRTLALVQALEPGMPTAYLTIQTARNNNVADGRWTGGRKLSEYASVPQMIEAAGGRTWSPYFKDIDKAAVDLAHRHRLQVLPWTVNEPADMRNLLEWGVDGIITDYPDRLRAVMKEFGLDLPRSLSR